MSLKRYDYEDPSAAGGSGQLRIVDRARGADKPIAWCTDIDVAQRIVRLLNADAEHLERQGAKAA